jgi:hypothetical protein
MSFQRRLSPSRFHELGMDAGERIASVEVAEEPDSCGLQLVASIDQHAVPNLDPVKDHAVIETSSKSLDAA